LGISYNQLQSGAYALLLAEEDGPFRIPVIIGAAEAQSIALKIEGITTPRPLTHDLFVSFAHAFGVKLKEVFIYKFDEGIFSSELTFSDGERDVVLDARTSDAIAIAIRTNTPIFTTSQIIEETGFKPIHEDSFSSSIRSNADDERQRSYQAEPNPERLAVEELERKLSKLINEENYEEAERISAIIDRKKAERASLNTSDNNQPL
jgi:bifunctional DNase/RNase